MARLSESRLPHCGSVIGAIFCVSLLTVAFYQLSSVTVDNFGTTLREIFNSTNTSDVPSIRAALQSARVSESPTKTLTQMPTHSPTPAPTHSALCRAVSDWRSQHCTNEPDAFRTVSGIQVVDFRKSDTRMLANISVDADGALNTYAYYQMHKCGWHLLRFNYRCDATVERAVRISQRVWVPHGCDRPLSSTVFADAFVPILPPNYRVLLLGNSHLGQIAESIAVRAFIRNEVISVRTFEQCFENGVDSASNLTKCSRLISAKNTCHLTFHEYDKLVLLSFSNGASLLKVKNALIECFDSASLIDTIVTLFGDGVDSITDVNLIIMNEGNKQDWRLDKRRFASNLVEFCRRRFESVNSQFTMDLVEFSNELSKRGFMNETYNLYLTAPVSYNTSLDSPWPFEFSARFQQWSDNAEPPCFSNDKCAPRKGHQCMPGYPDTYSEFVMIDAYNHFCQFWIIRKNMKSKHW